MKIKKSYAIIILTGMVFLFGFKCYERKLERDANGKIASLLCTALNNDFTLAEEELSLSFRKKLEINRAKVEAIYWKYRASMKLTDSLCQAMDLMKKSSNPEETKMDEENNKFLRFVEARDKYDFGKDREGRQSMQFNFNNTIVSMADDSLRLDLYKMKVRNTGNFMGNYLISMIGTSDFRFDILSAFVTNEAQVLRAGEKYVAQIHLGAYDTHHDPRIYVNGNLINVKDGLGMYSVQTREPGLHAYAGKIVVEDEYGEEKTYLFKSQYYVVPK